MDKVTCIGLDIAKNVFQVHGVDAQGKIVVRRTLTRSRVREFFAKLPPCLVGIEACASAHYWARELRKLGHEVRLMAGQFVAAYRKSGKNDANDAESICEAVRRPSMRFVAVKSEEQQAVLVLHRARSLAVQMRTAQANQIRSLLGEFGIVLPQGIHKLRERLPDVLEDAENGLPGLARVAVCELMEEFHHQDERVAGYERQINRLAAQSEPAKRLMQIEGVGPITATALVASIGDPRLFDSGRQFAAWLGLTPRQHSSGGKARLGSITKRGDVYLRTLLVHGARAVMRTIERRSDANSAWARALEARSGKNVAAVALAAKHARIIWAMLAKGSDYRSPRRLAETLDTKGFACREGEIAGDIG
ncbi:IS110 family transposase [Cupriavidus sp. BIC8F]|uniref:IS110 family transposase n=1 Tax=Cupriavidus sp. BIC8F TaxID=3079014 RepID=UPI002916FC23|nr:IS110 family transposase [Cupriavidus sp. BIC8F]